MYHYLPNISLVSSREISSAVGGVRRVCHALFTIYLHVAASYVRLKDCVIRSGQRSLPRQRVGGQCNTFQIEGSTVGIKN